MRKLALKMSMSLDGFVAGPNGEMDFFMVGRDQHSTQWVADQVSKAAAHLMGRKTFHSMASFWPTASGPFTKTMNETPKIVFSRHGFTASTATNDKNWADSQVLTGDLKDEIVKLKQQDGGLLLAQGGVEFAQNLVVTGQIDEYWFVVHPAVIGHGQSLFSKLKAMMALELIDTQKFAGGGFAHMYKPRI